MLRRIVHFIFFYIIVRSLVLFLLGLNSRYLEKLPRKGPAIIVANHNSHLDTMILMSLFKYRQLDYVRPVAAMDYFLRNKLLAWFATRIIGILPIARKRDEHTGDPLQPCYEALENNTILIFFSRYVGIRRLFHIFLHIWRPMILFFV